MTEIFSFDLRRIKKKKKSGMSKIVKDVITLPWRGTHYMCNKYRRFFVNSHSLVPFALTKLVRSRFELCCFTQTRTSQLADI